MVAAKYQNGHKSILGPNKVARLACCMVARSTQHGPYRLLARGQMDALLIQLPKVGVSLLLWQLAARLQARNSHCSAAAARTQILRPYAVSTASQHINAINIHPCITCDVQFIPMCR
jgi:hypothetical protein